jgi:acyl-CoA synthetase (AMP-forming)/AMP-acid ligase II
MADNLGTLLADACRKFAAQPALEEKNGTLNYSQLSAWSSMVASVLRGHGLTRDEPVLVPVGNEARDLAAFIGVWLAGGVVVPVARHSPAIVIEATRAVCGARFFAMGSDEMVRHNGHEAPRHRAMLAGAAIIIFTSGSTGRPKGVVLSHGAFARKLEAIDSKLSFSTKTRALLVLQITFVFGVWVTLLGLLKGGRVLMQPRFEALPVLEMLAEQGITDAAFVPTMLRKFLSLDRAVSEPLAACIKLDRILTGGEPLGRALSRQMRDFLPKTGLADIYGLTETCSSDFFLMPDEQDRFAGAIGRCSPGVRFRIADDEGNELPVGEVGELQIKTPFIMNGYLDEPDLTRAAFADDFFRTGDLARIRDDGLMELTGRAKELIMRGGAKIAPLELDGLLAQHPAVAAALTVGVPDRVMGECIHVLVVPRGGEQIDEAELRTWVASRIDRFKQPDTYHFGPELPTGRTGKVDRATLRKKICSGSP